ncbi:MAG: cache domain-containing protein [Bacteriovoracaceae bacterium]|nr:cache domain-containing protein [Bacteriovoracaceae bacterium]
MKKLVFLVAILAIIPFSLQAKQTEEMVINKVHTVCEEIKVAKDPQVIFNKITEKVHPYMDKDNKAFYVFVFSDEVTLLAHPIKRLVGKSLKGKPDVRGKKFRDKIVEGALKKGKGWVKYTYRKPGETAEKRKKTYYELCPNKGKNFVVGSGIYID